MYQFARGEDPRILQNKHVRRSIGTQISWGIRFTNVEQVRKFIGDLAIEVTERMAIEKLQGKKICLTVSGMNIKFIP